jgi:hypothetical protein
MILLNSGRHMYLAERAQIVHCLRNNCIFGWDWPVDRERNQLIAFRANEYSKAARSMVNGKKTWTREKRGEASHIGPFRDKKRPH